MLAADRVTVLPEPGIDTRGAALPSLRYSDPDDAGVSVRDPAETMLLAVRVPEAVKAATLVRPVTVSPPEIADPPAITSPAVTANPADADSKPDAVTEPAVTVPGRDTELALGDPP